MVTRSFPDTLLDMAMELDRSRRGLAVREEVLQGFRQSFGEVYPDLIGEDEPIVDVLKQDAYLRMLELDGFTDMENLKTVGDVAASMRTLRERLGVLTKGSEIFAMTPEKCQYAKHFLLGLYQWELSQLMREESERFMQEPESARA